MESNVTIKVTLVTFSNYLQYLGKEVFVEICCYEGGIIHPQKNILLGMNESYYYFKSLDKGDENIYWHNTTKCDEKYSIQVWDFSEFKVNYETETKSSFEEYLNCGEI